MVPSLKRKESLVLQYDQSNSNNQWILPFATFMTISENSGFGHLHVIVGLVINS